MGQMDRYAIVLLLVKSIIDSYLCHTLLSLQIRGISNGVKLYLTSEIKRTFVKYRYSFIIMYISTNILKRNPSFI